MSKKTIIVGSGFSALMMARMIRQYRDPAAEIVIVEKEARVGGQYGSIDYGEWGHFDVGMHIIYETCIPEIDNLFEDLLPEKDWIILEDNYKDIAGIYVNGRLQTDTPYVDLRNIEPARWDKFMSEIFRSIRDNKSKSLSGTPSAYDLLKHHFGELITDEIFVPILEKLYYTHPRNLAEIATKFTTINRLALLEADIMKDLMQSAEIRARICYPDQMTLPPYRANTQKGFYPRKYGMFRVMDRFKEVLEADGVRFCMSSAIGNFKYDGGKLTQVDITGKDNVTETLEVKELFWTAGLPGLAKALSIDLKGLPFDKKKTNDVYINLLFNKEPMMDKLYYFYPFDKGFRSFRITNYASYCPAAAGDRGFPVCVEFWAREEDPADQEGLIRMAVDELKAFGVIDDSYVLRFGKVEGSMSGFPLPSVTNINSMISINDKVKATGISNIKATGVLTGRQVFFIKDVLIDTYQKVIAKD